MTGAIIGDIAGSRFEGCTICSKSFELFTEECTATDDTNMSLAVAAAILEAGNDPVKLPGSVISHMQTIGRKYPHGFGHMFRQWIFSDDPKPYGSLGNGAAMRVSACGWAAENENEAVAMSHAVTGVSHNHPESFHAAEAVAMCVFWARMGIRREEIRARIEERYYHMDFTLDQIRPWYTFDVTCRGSVPQALEAFLESDGFEDAIRNAVSLGGDTDTIAAITGSIAEACYGIPKELRNRARQYLTEDRLQILDTFEAKYGRG